MQAKSAFPRFWLAWQSSYSCDSGNGIFALCPNILYCGTVPPGNPPLIKGQYINGHPFWEYALVIYVLYIHGHINGILEV